VVKDIVLLWDLSPNEIYAIVDDVDLPLGTIRIRPKGGDGCHRGMENIIYHLQSDQFPRVRLGIGTDDIMRPAENYVLKPFQPDAKSEVEAMVKRGADALDALLIQGLNHTMNHFNA
jgi:PTH1 family peptidyl-tRNA hydrolase